MPGDSVTCQVSVTVTAAHRQAGAIAGYGHVYALQLDAPATSDTLSIAVSEHLPVVTVSLAAYQDVRLTTPVTGALDQGDSVYFQVTVHNDTASPLSSAYSYLFAHDVLSNFHSCFFYLGDHNFRRGTVNSTIGYAVTHNDRIVGSVTRLCGCGPINSAAHSIRPRSRSRSINRRHHFQVTDVNGDLLIPPPTNLRPAVLIQVRFTITNDGPSKLTNAVINLSGSVSGQAGVEPARTPSITDKV